MSDYQDLIAILQRKVGPIDLPEILALLENQELPANSLGIGSVPRPWVEKLAETVSVKDFGAVGDGVTDDTAAFVAAETYAWNSGAVRCAVYMPPGTYLVSDLDADGTALSWHDGVGLYGDGYASILRCTTAVKALRILGYGAGWRKPSLRDFVIDGDGVATVGLEFYVGAEQRADNILIRNAARGMVLDGTQNGAFIGVKAKDCGVGISILNGAGSNVLLGCGVDASTTRHLIIDNDSNWPAYNLLNAPLYASPRHNRIIGGVYERTITGEEITSSLLVDEAAYNVFESVVFALTETASATCIADLAVNSSNTTFRNCQFYGSSASIPAVNQAGFMTVLDGCIWIGCLGHFIAVTNGKLTHVIRPSGTPEASKKVVSHLTGTANARSDVVIIPERAGGTGAQLPVMGDGFIPYYYHAIDNQVRHFDPGLGGVGGWVKKIQAIDGSGAPTFNAKHVGEIWIDTTADDAYIAIQVGAGASDWKKITP